MNIRQPEALWELSQAVPFEVNVEGKNNPHTSSFGELGPWQTYWEPEGGILKTIPGSWQKFFKDPAPCLVAASSTSDRKSVV